jgi:oxygen-independent coproporphyrinogen-3 oxidase
MLNIHRPFHTIYVGGGTPGILSPGDIEILCRILTQNNGDIHPVEFSMEFSPTAVKKEKIEILRNHHCSRVTIGVQTFNEKTMRALGRRQPPARIFDAYEIVAEGGIENIGIDLIFGVPGQTIGEWLADLQCAIDLHPKHISTYNLTLEDGTPLTQNLLTSAAGEKSEEETLNFYVKTWEFLESNGYVHYEISNFCLPGYESIHNLNTWEMQNWIGIGPSACSQYGSRRFSNPPSLLRWLNAIEGNTLAHENIEAIDEKNMAEDCIIFGLRMNRGINLPAIKKRFKAIDFTNLDELFSRLEHEKFLWQSRNFVRLTRKGRLVADAIAANILEVV